MSEKVDALCTKLSLAAVAHHYASLADEAQLRDERRREVLMRLAGFPPVKTLEQFDFDAAAGVPKARIQELAGLAFIERRENVIFLGPSGSAVSTSPSSPTTACSRTLPAPR